MTVEGVMTRKKVAKTVRAYARAIESGTEGMRLRVLADEYFRATDRLGMTGRESRELLREEIAKAKRIASAIAMVGEDLEPDLLAELQSRSLRRAGLVAP